ncbi:hypothetical protein A2303_02545 [Candidatus Falkowbacteria bacterium RIFOXYB2_FULL_47_14]|uniref:Uncharacterized protein n=1 Tax=Candidatus Falkowbacteria bacterium RIFOXYA2_FULL_47_19 TaxID=1797994 RepID=A0A1F5SKT9_9BACT|nr:MAG: hypothetical protein A2227_06325 [Candidatus Falkowbacteria bacterium RIFOXYA2_FULL_47_19]OGF35923.1 MAG: hypothetical protein A2468_01780 [Candidatus Falkowbacteria bacterium RIFOXYC2_FULL_46_15]OGF43939.1 MAG: hypothetical protein A2303_02545 [Candidatus Falkowbacteria bacterium RIFOXYB2_FULL_47_14]
MDLKLRFLRIHFVKIGIMALNLLFGNRLAYWFAGWFFKNILGNSVQSVFLLYPANPKYAAAYVYDWYRRQMKWKPRLVGIIVQYGKFKPYFGISASDEDIWADAAAGGHNLAVVLGRMDSIRRLLRAEYATYAGIIPGVSLKLGLIKSSIECDTTVAGVIQAIEKVKRSENLPDDVKLVILGGKGFIGRRLVDELRSLGNETYSVDLKDDWPEAVSQPVIVVNVSKGGAIADYIPALRPGTVIINEVYPEPRAKELAAIKEREAICYHVKGAPGWAWRRFPGAYENVIPLCASHIPKNNGYKFEAVVEKL